MMNAKELILYRAERMPLKEKNERGDGTIHADRTRSDRKMRESTPLQLSAKTDPTIS